MDATNAAAFVPTLRPSGRRVLAYVEQAARELGENDGNVPESILAEARPLVSERDRREIVAAFHAQEPEIYEELVAAIPEQLEQALVASAIKGAICDRRPVPRMHLVLLEHAPTLPKTAAARLSLVLPSGAVWSVREAVSLLEDGVVEWDSSMDDTAPLVVDRVAEWQVDRVRLLAAALADNLPLASLPHASAVVAADCEDALRHAATARATAALLLVSHTAMVAAQKAGEAPSLN
jgi:hypothetical protein